MDEADNASAAVSPSKIEIGGLGMGACKYIFILRLTLDGPQAHALLPTFVDLPCPNRDAPAASVPFVLGLTEHPWRPSKGPPVGFGPWGSTKLAGCSSLLHLKRLVRDLLCWALLTPGRPSSLVRRRWHWRSNVDTWLCRTEYGGTLDRGAGGRVSP